MMKSSAVISILWMVMFVGFAVAVDQRLVINGEFEGDQFGDAVAILDFNADDFDDYVVAAPASDEGGTSSGKVYVFFGGPEADDVADITIIGPAGSFFGSSLADAGDVNNDNFADLIVGAPFYSDIASRAGSAYIFYGGPSPDTVVDLAFYGQQSLGYFGTSVAGKIDLNNDQIDDFAIGAYKIDYDSYSDAGLVFVHYGSDSPDTTTDMILTGDADGERFGYSLVGGDFDGDQTGDIAVGAYSYDDWAINIGRAYIFFGGSSPDSLFDVAIRGEIEGAFFGYSLAAGNTNNDSYDDLLVGAYGYHIGTAEAGKIYLYEGSAAFDTIADYSHTLNREKHDHLGLAVAAGVDFNQDLSHEFWAGFPGSNDNGIDTGGCVVYLGSSYAVDTIISGNAAEERFGHCAAMSATFFGPLEPSIAVGAYAYNNSRGRVYIFSQDNSSGNHPPVLDSIGPQSVIQGDSLLINVTASDADGTYPELSVDSLPENARFFDSLNGSGLFEWLPDIDQIGLYVITFYASDGIVIDSEQVIIEVIEGGLICGDANNDGGINVADAVYIINWIFKSGPAPEPLCIANVNGDGGVNVADVVYLINYIFKSGPPPIEPCCP